MSSAFGGSRVLVVYGGQSAKRSGLLDRIMACLKEENLYAVELGGVKPNPRSGLVYEGIELCRREKIDFILAVGGGSVIDTAKAIAIGVPYDGDFWDFFSGKVPEQALPVGTVLTIAASGSEGSPDSIITNEKTLEKNGAGSRLPPALLLRAGPCPSRKACPLIRRPAASRTSWPTPLSAISPIRRTWR